MSSRGNSLKGIRKHLKIRRSFLIVFCFLLLLSPFGTTFNYSARYVQAEEERIITEQVGKDVEGVSSGKESGEGDFFKKTEVGEEAEFDMEVSVPTKDEGEEKEEPENETESSSDGIAAPEIVDAEEKDVEIEARNMLQLNGDIQPLADQSDFETIDNSDGTVKIIAYSGTDTDITIPSEIDGKRVTVIGQSAFRDKGLTSVILPNTVMNIESNAFRDNKLTVLTIPQTVQKMNQYAFAYNELENVTLGSGLTEISYGVLRGNNLRQITLPNHITKIDNQAFLSNNLETIVIPETVKEIGSYALAFNKLTNVSIPASVEKIGDDAFRVNELSEVTVKSPATIFEGNQIFLDNQSNPANLIINGHDPSTAKEYASAHGYSFQAILPKYETTKNNDGTLTITGYNGIDTDIEIPSEINGKTVTIIGEHAFSDKGLTSVIFPDTITTIGDFAFQSNRLTAIDLPDHLLTIGAYSFASNVLEKMVIPNSVTRINVGAFDSNKLDRVEFGTGLIYIGDDAFRKNKLSSAKMPDQLTTIGMKAFAENQLTSITFSDKLEYIGTSAFDSNKLEEVIIPESVETILDGSFNNNNLKEVYIYGKDTAIVSGMAFEDNPDNLIIYGHAGSKAEEHAEKYDHTFIAFSTVHSVNEMEDIEVDVGTTATAIPLPTRVDIELADGRTLQIPVIWEDPLPFDGEVSGDYLITGQLDLPAYISNPANLNIEVTVRVQEKIYEIIDIQTLTDIEVAYGTELSDIHLPKMVTATSEGNKVLFLDVEWDMSSYNGHEPGTYTLSGTLELKDSVTNPNNLVAKIKIIVEEQPNEDKDPDTDKIITGSYYAWTPLKTGHYKQGMLPLPDSVKVTLNDGGKVELEVDWHVDSEPIYDRDVAGDYLFSGEFKLIDGIANPYEHQPKYMFRLSDAVAIVKHVDEAGKELAPEEILTGKMHDEYITKPKEIDGYILTETPTNALGEFQYFSITVTYIYRKDSKETPEEPETPRDKEPTDNEVTNIPIIGTAIEVGSKKLSEVQELFPSKVEVELGDGSLTELYVNWSKDSKPSYNKNLVGTYTFYGELVLKDGITNPLSHKIEYWVNVIDSDKVSRPEESGKTPDDGGDRSESPKDSKDPVGGADSEDLIVTVDKRESKGTSVKIDATNDGKTLPKTATAYYTFILVGFMLIVLSGTTYIIRRRKQAE
ncbi:leucine-rich repeat protein [Pseudogracilibacillus auburnensis]|uniref:leucine-rich repeat protein n=1 Tax=Pseudogracilibacillus auburnensis TaxID=1494959 RepID=UPI001A959C07|nr:leucine-rich repeat protein [Pseudogracilibacillus auburnensis]MBO1005306.1 leucine-rich repeat protein [Pseudogracilibacillus auburnensis]